MSIWRDTIVRNAEGRERMENSIEVKLQEFCGRHKRNIDLYTITPDGLVDCSGNISIWDDDLVDGKLPFRFGEVKGCFNVSICEELTFLEGCPKKVGDDFSCLNCTNLKSLEGCPQEVGGNFYCYDCKVSVFYEDVTKRCKVKGTIHTRI